MQRQIVTLGDERGQTLVYVAVAIVVLLGFVALATDTGLAYVERRQMQNAADAGALAAISVLARGGADAEVLAAVQQYATTENHADTVQASYIGGPGSAALGSVGGGSIPSGATGVRVSARRTAPTFLAGVLGISTVSAQASGAGGLGLVDIVLVLDRSGSMDDDSCSWKPYPPTGGVSCSLPVDQTNCTRCYVLQSGVRKYGTWTPPPQPITAAKNAAATFVDLNNPTLARLGLVSYSDGATLNRGLTADFAAVKTSINGLVANGCTAAPAGISQARGELTGARSRPEAMDVIVFLTDGLPNSPYCSGCPDYCPAAKTATRNEAQAAAGQRITIYTISLGDKADQALMQDVANLTGGEHFYAPTCGGSERHLPEDLRAHSNAPDRVSWYRPPG